MNTHAKNLAEKIGGKIANISIIGLGYVGLNISIAFAREGFTVYGYDIDHLKIEKLKKGENYINEEKNLSILLPKVLDDKFHPSSDVAEASERGDVIIVIVPTADGDVPTLSYLKNALDSVKMNDIRGKLILIESTVKVGTTEDFVRSQLETGGMKAGVDFFIAYSPERIDPGNLKMTFDHIPKIVGGVNAQSSDLGAMLYKHVVDEVIQVSNARTAEFVKLMENTQRDMNIALVNLFAMMCEESHIDVEEAMAAAATKWNFHQYRPGCGVGGHCLKKDPILLAQSFEESFMDLSLIYSSRRINDMMPILTSEKALIIAQHISNKKLEDVTIGILGLSYKKNSSDIRNSPAFAIITHLKEAGIKRMNIYDPLTDVESQCEASEILKSDIIIYTVDHNGFKSILQSFDGFIIDGTNTLNPSDRIFGVGRILGPLEGTSAKGGQMTYEKVKRDSTIEIKDH